MRHSILNEILQSVDRSPSRPYLRLKRFDLGRKLKVIDPPCKKDREKRRGDE